MKKTTLAFILGSAILLGSTPLYAQEEGEGEVAEVTQEDASCQIECPNGQSKVTFADGGRVSCVCSEAATVMVETPEEAAPCEDPNDDGVCG